MSGPEATWRAALAEGRFLIQRDQTGRGIFPPRIMPPGSGTGPLEWVEASGRGTVYSFSWISQKPPAAAYNVAVIELAEGCRLMSRIEGVDESSLRIGLPVTAFISSADEAALLLFRPTENDQ